MTKIKQLPSLLNDAFLSVDQVNTFAQTLNFDPGNLFSPNDNKIGRLQKIHRTAIQQQYILNYLVEAHNVAPHLPISDYLHLIMRYSMIFPDEQVTAKYVEIYANKDGTYTGYDLETQARMIQENFKETGQGDAFFDLIFQQFPQVKDYPFLHPSHKVEIPLPDPPSDRTSTPPKKETTYIDFDINISPADSEGVYQVTAASGNSQTQNISRQTLPDDASFTDTLMMLQSLFVDEDSVTKLGELIHNFLFPPEVTKLFTKIRAQHDNVRIRINIFGESLRLHQIPWEYCRYDNEFFATDLSTPVVRFIPAFQEGATLQTPEQMRVLVALSSPADQPPINVAKEDARIQKALAPLEKRGQIDLQLHENMTNDDLIDEFMDFQPHIFHFVGHGGTKDNGEGFILLEDWEGNTAEFDAEDMMTLVKTTNGATKLVIFAACESGVAGEGASVVENGGFMGMGPRILKEVPAVIAMQYTVPQETAFDFTKNVYAYLAKGEPLDRAVTRSRIRIYLKGKDKVFWGIPVLFMRSPDGKIW
ncbi:MAG: CHAT domain-containing protein [Chloroflexota bacterium]